MASNNYAEVIIGGLVDLHHAHHIVRQDRLHYLGDTIEYLANVEHIGQGAQQTVEHCKIGCDITRLRLFGMKFPKPHGRALYSSQVLQIRTSRLVKRDLGREL